MKLVGGSISSMNSKEERNLLKSQELCDYINCIKQRKKNDIYSIINTTLIADPYSTNFPKDFFFERVRRQNKLATFFINTVEFYARSFIHFLNYIQTFIYYKFLYRKKYQVMQQDFILDVYVSIDRTNKEGVFNEFFFSSLYSILRKRQVNYVFIPRLHDFSANPFKLHYQLRNFFKIINKDSNHFLFEFELLSVKDFLYLLWLVICYPFKTLRLIIKEEQKQDISFNTHLLKDISKQGVNSFSRYILGKNIANIANINKIYSWSEFQSIERSFNYSIRKNGNIEVYACQFWVSYPVYFSSVHIQDIDETNNFAPSKVLVNGCHYLLKRKKVDYQLGVSLRYQKLFKYQKQNTESNIVVLGSHLIDETRGILRLVNNFDKVLFKSHPNVNINDFQSVMGKNIKVVNENIYDLFPKATLIIGGATGALVEAVACGVSVIVVAEESELTINPLTIMGKSKIWDIAFSKGEMKQKSKQLIEFRNKNMNEINDIAIWYKNNLFIEPSEENIVKTFELK